MNISENTEIKNESQEKNGGKMESDLADI